MSKAQQREKILSYAHAPLAIALFLGSRHFLIRWYNFEHVSDDLLGLACLLAMVLLGFRVFFRSGLRQVAREAAHPWLISGLLFLLLPWAEWLRLGFMANRSEWSLQSLYQCGFVYGCLTLARWMPPLSRGLDHASRFFARRLSRAGTGAILALPVLAAALSAALCLSFQGGLPHIQDGVAYLFQAKIFESGRIWAPAPALPDFFSTSGDMIYAGNGRWFSIFLPGYPLLLAAGLLLHAPWIVTPLVSAVALFLLMLFLRDRFGNSTATGFGILFLLSPFVLILSSEYMAHVPELAAAALALYATSRLSDERNATLNSLLLIVALVAGALIRVFTVYSFLCPLLAWFAWTSVKRERYALLLAPAIGILTGVSLLLWYQWQTTGNPLVTGYLLKYPEYRFGFGKTFLHQTHTPLLGLENTSNHLNSLNAWLNGWPVGAFVFPLLFLHRGGSLSTWEKILLACGGCILLFHFFFVGIDLDLGPRMIFLFSLPVLLMNVRGIQVSRELARDSSRGAAALLLCASCVWFATVSAPAFLRRMDHSNATNVQLRHEIEKRPGQKMLIFVSDQTRYSDQLVFNSPFLDGDVVVARDLEERNKQLEELYPAYEVLYFRPDSSLEKRQGSLVASNRYVLSTQPGKKPQDEISYFDVLAMVQTAAGLRSPDLMDLAPGTALARHCGTIEAFLVRPQEATGVQGKDYVRRFRASLDVLIRFLSLPQCAYEKSGGQWQSVFDPGQFRHFYQAAREKAVTVPQLSVEIEAGLNKIGSRVDRNGDGALSDAEIRDYVSEKMKEFKRYSFFGSR